MAKKQRKTKHAESAIQLRGMFRVQLVEQDGRISGDSGWVKNRVVNLGMRDYILIPLAAGASKPVQLMALGTGGVPNATDTSLPGELSHFTGASSTRNRIAVNSSSIGSTAMEFQAVFQSAVGVVTAAANISNIMVINSTMSGGTIFAGNTFASNDWGPLAA